MGVDGNIESAVTPYGRLSSSTITIKAHLHSLASPLPNLNMVSQDKDRIAFGIWSYMLVFRRFLSDCCRSSPNMKLI